MDVREDRQAVRAGGGGWEGVTSCRHCSTPPAQCCYKRKEGNARRMRDIKHYDVRREREMFWPRVHSTDGAGSQTQSVGGTETVREAKVVTAFLQRDQLGCWIKGGVKNKMQPKTLCRAEKPHAP